MAKQVGPLFFTGTVDGIIFYKLGDQYYMRSKGDYKSGKQMRKDRTYQRTMQQANRFGGAAKLVKEVYYRHLPRAVRKHGLFGKLTGLVNRWLYAGKAIAEVRELLLAHCQTLAAGTPTNNGQQSTIADQRTTHNAQRKTINVQRTTPSTHPPTHRVKQARYLSKWKVKRDGRLHIPKRKAVVEQRLQVEKLVHPVPPGYKTSLLSAT